MKAAIYVLSILIFILLGVSAALWLSPPLIDNDMNHKVRFGLYEGRELVKETDRDGNVQYVVEDSGGRKLFNIPVRNSLLDVRYRDGRLRFRENGTERTGYIDRDGKVQLDKVADSREQLAHETAEVTTIIANNKASQVHQASSVSQKGTSSYQLNDEELRCLPSDHPFYKEASRILSGKLEVDDEKRRRVILNYCEHFRTAYTTKDIDFLRQIFSEQALIIVGNVVKVAPDSDKGVVADKRVEYYLRTKSEYLARLSKAFAANKKIDVKFSDFRILRHPTIDGIYGVSLRQRYHSDQYSDDGWLFLLWDFRNESMPLIHVRTWQPSAEVEEADDVINISDFNLQ